MYKKILVATDGSPSSEYAALHAVGLAGTHKCALVFLYVTPRIVEAVDYFNAADLEKAMGAEAERFLADAAKLAAKAGVTAETKALTGEPEEEIVRYASEVGADLIVMGSHGHKGFVKLLIGSVAERVIGNAHCPVLVMKR